ncbi:ABC transporter permease [Actinoallomurus purpureus]|uniref:ABC transporter permease n=1 Tax=Actinoallomurus purpureus TaxID=478114 RepID=UPI0020923C4D|nr:ABC transporter permease [Actinoallomurus purpureus]MCO6006886.1 ABC transporter permease [Actinoallomurus purpureus]
MTAQKVVGDQALPDSGVALPRRPRAVRRLARGVPSLVIVAALLAGWQIYAVTGNLGTDVLPSPAKVASEGWAHRAELWDNTLPTLRATFAGFALSLVVGFALSVLIDASAVARRALLPLLVVTQTLPLIAIAPLVVLWFGFALLPKVLIVALVTFFPITVGLVEGYAATDRDSEVLLRTMGAGRWRIFRTLRVPTALPFFFAGLRIAITYAVVAAIFAEYAGATSGLGIYMQNAKNSFRTDLVLATVAVSSALTLVLFGLTYVVERLVTPWVHLARRQGRAS